MRNLFLLIALCCVAFSVRAQRLVEVGKGFSSTSVNTTVFRNNSIVTHGNTQYISYYDVWALGNGFCTVPNTKDM